MGGYFWEPGFWLSLFPVEVGSCPVCCALGSNVGRKRVSLATAPCSEEDLEQLKTIIPSWLHHTIKSIIEYLLLPLLSSAGKTVLQHLPGWALTGLSSWKQTRGIPQQLPVACKM
ncbi:uncharacterized protein LOC119805911 isoform X6 [Arvicola amphibius]|uniref:uncharacterized protein LOC119805911 isoform X6 n=1 Tax=Arvicola amphibius TaxID=1047088 RepID=UPI0018E3F141|nr:uncharacterized protein LOC119805911 isoform X6 [Arvicola amphibius]